MAIAHPYLMFLGEAADHLAAKTAQGIVHWRPEWCLGQLRLPGCQADLGIPDMSLAEATAAGGKTVIAGEGVSIDAVVSDFVSGAVEHLAPANDPDHWDLIEGQGSLFHPSYAGVTLGLIHGSQPDVLVLCHEPTRKHLRGFPITRCP